MLSTKPFSPETALGPWGCWSAAGTETRRPPSAGRPADGAGGRPPPSPAPWSWSARTPWQPAAGRVNRGWWGRRGGRGEVTTGLNLISAGGGPSVWNYQTAGYVYSLILLDGLMQVMLHLNYPSQGWETSCCYVVSDIACKVQTRHLKDARANNSHFYQPVCNLHLCVCK